MLFKYQARKKITHANKRAYAKEYVSYRVIFSIRNSIFYYYLHLLQM